MTFSVRLAGQSDVPTLTEIYNQAIALGTATADIEPVSTDSRRAWLAEHDADKYPVYSAVTSGAVAGYCSLSAYRPGRLALRYTAEISYYIHESFRGQGVASLLIEHVLGQCQRLEIKTLFAILLDVNEHSVRLLEKFQFERWGHMPRVADFGGTECGHLYYGRRLVT